MTNYEKFIHDLTFYGEFDYETWEKWLDTDYHTKIAVLMDARWTGIFFPDNYTPYTLVDKREIFQLVEETWGNEDYAWILFAKDGNDYFTWELDKLRRGDIAGILGGGGAADIVWWDSKKTLQRIIDASQGIYFYQGRIIDI